MQIEAGEGGGAHREQCEPTLVGGVNEFGGRGRGLGEDAEPAEGIVALEFLEYPGGNGRARDAVESIASGDDVALKRVGPARLGPGDVWPVGGDVVWNDLFGVEDDLAVPRQAGRDQVAHHELLTVDHDVPAGEGLEVDPVIAAIEAQQNAVMTDAVLLHAGSDTDLGEQGFRGVFEEAGADAGFDVFAGVALKHDGVDAAQIQQMREEKAGRAGTDDGDLGALHGGNGIGWRAGLGENVMPGPDELKAEFLMLMARAGLTVPAERLPELVKDFADLREQVALLHKGRPATVESASVYAIPRGNA